MLSSWDTAVCLHFKVKIKIEPEDLHFYELSTTKKTFGNKKQQKTSPLAKP